MYEVIDPNQWKRKSLYAFFKTYDNPTWDLISEVRITHFYNSIKEKGNPFFLSFLYAATAVGNTIEEMRCRISPEGEVRKYDRIHPGSTVLYENGTYGYGYFEFNPDYQSFLDSASTELEKQKSRQDVDPKDEDLARFYFSPIPWVSFSGFRHPYRQHGNLSIPMIVFGKHYEKDGERYLPVGLTLHHGLADGYHAGLFFTRLQEVTDRPDWIFAPGLPWKKIEERITGKDE